MRTRWGGGGCPEQSTRSTGRIPPSLPEPLPKMNQVKQVEAMVEPLTPKTLVSCPEQRSWPPGGHCPVALGGQSRGFGPLGIIWKGPSLLQRDRLVEIRA